MSEAKYAGSDVSKQWLEVAPLPGGESKRYASEEGGVNALVAALPELGILNRQKIASLVAIRHNPQIRRFYERLRGAGKPAQVALTACMRKLLLILNAMLKTNQPFHAGTPFTT